MSLKARSDMRKQEQRTYIIAKRIRPSHAGDICHAKFQEEGVLYLCEFSIILLH